MQPKTEMEILIQEEQKNRKVWNESVLATPAPTDGLPQPESSLPAPSLDGIPALDAPERTSNPDSPRLGGGLAGEPPAKKQRTEPAEAAPAAAGSASADQQKKKEMTPCQICRQMGMPGGTNFIQAPYPDAHGNRYHYHSTCIHAYRLTKSQLKNEFRQTMLTRDREIEQMMASNSRLNRQVYQLQNELRKVGAERSRWMKAAETMHRSMGSAAKAYRDAQNKRVG